MGPRSHSIIMPRLRRWTKKPAPPPPHVLFWLPAGGRERKSPEMGGCLLSLLVSRYNNPPRLVFAYWLEGVSFADWVRFRWDENKTGESLFAAWISTNESGSKKGKRARKSEKERAVVISKNKKNPKNPKSNFTQDWNDGKLGLFYFSSFNIKKNDSQKLSFAC